MRLLSACLIFLLVLNFQASAQVVCSPLGMGKGFGEYNVQTFSEKTISSDNFSGLLLGASSFDPVNKRYIFVRRDLTNSCDDLVLLDAGSGLELQSIRIPEDGIMQPEYSISDNTIYGVSPTGFASYDLTNNVFMHIKEYPHMLIMAGMSTFSQATHTYLAGINQQLVAIDIKTGQRTFYEFPFSDFETDDSTGLVYGKKNNSLFSLNLKTGEIRKVSDNGLSSVLMGASTYDQAHHEYIEEGPSGTNMLLMRINVLTGEARSTTLGYQYLNPEYYDSTKPIVLRTNDKAAIYPNPVTDQLHLHLPELNKTGSLTATVYDMRGKFINTYQLYTSTDPVINLNALSKGVYLLRIYDSNTVRIERVVKE